MYLSNCPQLKLRHAVVTASELGFVTRASVSSSAVRRFSNDLLRKAQLPVARCDSRTNGGEKREARGGAWGAWRKPRLFSNCDQFSKSLSPMERKLCAAGMIFVLAAIAWFRNLAAAGLVDDTEPLFAEAARQMLLTGDFVTPQFNAQPRFDKPVLIYWLMALSGKLLGPSAAALRLPSALCALALLLGLLVTVKEFGLQTSFDTQPPESSSPSEDHYVPAIITSAAFALNLEVVAWGSTALSDMLLTSMLGGSLLSFFWGYAGRKLTPPKHKWGYSVSAIFMSLACLSKGPIGIAFPVGVCALFLLSTGELLEVLIEEMPYWKGILALMLINLPWYGLMAAKHGLSYIHTFFGYHNIERFMQGVNHHGGRPWWYGLAVVAVMYFPWSLSLPPALLQAGPWRQSWRKTQRCHKLPSFAASWLIAGFALFALSSSQLPSYYLPVAPAIALLAAVHASRSATLVKSRLLSCLVPAILYLLLAVGFWVLPACLQNSGDTVAVHIGIHVSEGFLRHFPVVLFALAGIATFATSELGSWVQPVESTGEVPTAKTSLPMWVIHTAVMACFLGFFLTPMYSLIDSVRQAPLRHVAYAAAATEQKTGEPLVMVGTRMTSVVFYSKLPTAFFNSPPEALLAIQEEAAPWVTSALIITDMDTNLFQPPPDILATSGDYKLLRCLRRPKS